MWDGSAELKELLPAIYSDRLGSIVLCQPAVGEAYLHVSVRHTRNIAYNPRLCQHIFPEVYLCLVVLKVAELEVAKAALEGGMTFESAPACLEWLRKHCQIANHHLKATGVHAALERAKQAINTRTHVLFYLRTKAAKARRERAKAARARVFTENPKILGRTALAGLANSSAALAVLSPLAVRPTGSAVRAMRPRSSADGHTIRLGWSADSRTIGQPSAIRSTRPGSSFAGIGVKPFPERQQQYEDIVFHAQLRAESRVMSDIRTVVPWGMDITSETFYLWFMSLREGTRLSASARTHGGSEEANQRASNNQQQAANRRIEYLAQQRPPTVQEVALRGVQALAEEPRTAGLHSSREEPWLGSLWRIGICQTCNEAVIGMDRNTFHPTTGEQMSITRETFAHTLVRLLFAHDLVTVSGDLGLGNAWDIEAGALAKGLGVLPARDILLAAGPRQLPDGLDPHAEGNIICEPCATVHWRLICAVELAVQSKLYL